MKPFKIMLLLSIFSFSSNAISSDENWVLDARFATLDIVEMVNQYYPDLSNRAELISHYSGYYNINPFLLSEYIRLYNNEVIEQSKMLFKVVHGLKKSTIKEELNATSISNAQKLMTVLLTSKVLKAATDENRPVLDLPFDHEKTWHFNGVHTWTGQDDGSPMSSIDLTRSWGLVWGAYTSDDWIVASHDGIVTVFSSCYMRITHESGWATDYYHLDNILVKTGDKVNAGQFVSNYANSKAQALCQGGSSTGPHLHFTLLKNGERYALDGIDLSLWKVHSGTFSYDVNITRMWLEKLGEKKYARQNTLGHLNGDNEVDYRYNGVYSSSTISGHGINVTVTQQVNQETQEVRNIVFLAFYTYDDVGQSNFYVGNVDFDNWRLDETKTIDLLQTSGGNFTDLQTIDFNTDTYNAGTIALHFLNCSQVEVDISLIEPVSSKVVEHHLVLSKIIGVPDHVCQAPSLLISSSVQK